MEENRRGPSKKRVAGREISKDDPGLDDDGSEPEMGSFKRASEDVIANRRIVKARRLHTPSQPMPSSSNPFSKINFIVPVNSKDETEKTSERNPLGDETPLFKQGSSKSENEVTGNGIKVDGEKEADDRDVDTEGNIDTTPPVEDEKEKNITDKDAAPSNVMNEDSLKDNEDNQGENLVVTGIKDTGTSIKAASDKTTVNEGAEKELVTEAKKQGAEHKDKSELTAPLSSFQQLSSSQNAFTGLSGTFSFGSLSKDGPAFSSGSGSLFGAHTSEKPAFSSFGMGSSNNGTNKLFGSNVADTIKAGGGGSSAPTMQEVPVETGEENEKVVFKADSILFEYINGGWKERGKGELKVDVSTVGAQKARLVMRARGNYRLILNSCLYPDMSLKAMDKRSVTFACVNTPGGGGKDGLTTFALKFRENTVMEEFRETVTAYKGKNDDDKPSKTPENSPKPSDA
ncbi:putative Ran-binding protein [Zostera marina]|uniref:Putative Ran-binding protein n=1 Tax=Zostera marina TaxID=29655 RepID=A0A0K9NHF5_ZOSMR|nr:putative Ran-binding protein [Zostera marina]